MCAVMYTGLGARWTWTGILVLLLTISVVSSKSFKHSYLQYTSWDNKETYLSGLLGRLNEMMSVEPLVYLLT